jgi:hypothetical protein
VYVPVNGPVNLSRSSLAEAQALLREIYDRPAIGFILTEK